MQTSICNSLLAVLILIAALTASLASATATAVPAAVAPALVPTAPTAAAVSAGTAYTPEQLHAYIAQGTPEQQRLAATELARLGLPQLLLSATHSDEMVRYEAVNALGALGDPRAVRVLLRVALTDGSLYARHRAIWALGTVAARDAALARTVMSALQQLHLAREAPAAERWRAVLALGLLGDESMGRHITTVLAQTEDEATAWEGLNALATTPSGDAAQALPAIYPYLTHAAPRVAEAAVRALAKTAERHNNSAHTAALAEGTVVVEETELGRIARKALAAAAAVHQCPQVARRARSLGEAMKARKLAQNAERSVRRGVLQAEHKSRFNLKSEL